MKSNFFTNEFEVERERIFNVLKMFVLGRMVYTLDELYLTKNNFIFDSDIILDKLLEGSILKPIQDLFDRSVIYLK